jgi:hypothetical protein
LGYSHTLGKAYGSCIKEACFLLTCYLGKM